jgi:hypothetical protein
LNGTVLKVVVRVDGERSRHITHDVTRGQLGQSRRLGYVTRLAYRDTSANRSAHSRRATKPRTCAETRSSHWESATMHTSELQP